jgi:hypothetical protein
LLKSGTIEACVKVKVKRRVLLMAARLGTNSGASPSKSVTTKDGVVVKVRAFERLTAVRA